MSNPFREAFIQGLRPEDPLTVSQWADKYRKLSSKASAEPGPWRTRRTPYLQLPMDCLSSSSPVQRVVMQFAAQTGKSESGLNWLAYIMHHAPGPCLAVQPTVDMCKRLSKQRLESMIAETPCLAEKIAHLKQQRGEVEAELAALDDKLNKMSTEHGALNSRLGVLEDLEHRYEGMGAGVRGLLTALDEGSAHFPGEVSGVVA